MTNDNNASGKAASSLMPVNLSNRVLIGHENLLESVLYKEVQCARAQ